MNLKKFYINSGYLCQELFVNLYGAKRSYLRYFGNFHQYFKYLLETQWQDIEKLRTIQLINIKKIIDNACNVPYYRELFKQIGLKDSKDISNIEDLKYIPYLEKETLRQNVEYLKSEIKKEFTIKLITSGTTGTPIKIYMYHSDFRKRMAFLERQYNWASLSHHNKHATFTGKYIVGPNELKKLWHHNYFDNQLLFSIYHLREECIFNIINKIMRFKPDFIEGYPSVLYIVAKYINQKFNKRSIILKAVFCTAETLYENVRKEIENAFSCKVYNYYASNEGAPFISQCYYGNYHINLESGMFEFIPIQESDEENLCELIVTPFTSNYMPLIRYRIGDFVTLYKSEKGCPCGRRLPIVKDIIGRADDILFTPYKGWVTRLSTSLKLLPKNVKRSQIKQIGLEDFELIIECRDKINANDISSVIIDLKNKLGPVRISVKTVDNISQSNSIKFRSQISLLHKSELKNTI